MSLLNFSDTGISPIQWQDKKRGFCHMRNGVVDLRFDPTDTEAPKAYEVLQNIDENSLLKLLINPDEIFL